MIFFRFWIDLFGSRENGEEKDFWVNVSRFVSATKQLNSRLLLFLFFVLNFVTDGSNWRREYTHINQSMSFDS